MRRAKSKEQPQEETAPPKEPDSGSVEVRPGTGRVYMTPFGFHRFAIDFLDASRALLPHTSGRARSVKYFLLYKSIELSLKAFLLTRGISLELLANTRKYGHRILNVLDLAQEKGLDNVVHLSDEQLSAVRFGAEYYFRRTFDYFDFIEAVTGSKGDPDVHALEGAASALIEGLREVIHEDQTD